MRIVQLGVLACTLFFNVAQASDLQQGFAGCWKFLRPTMTSVASAMKLEPYRDSTGYLKLKVYLFINGKFQLIDQPSSIAVNGETAGLPYCYASLSERWENGRSMEGFWMEFTQRAPIRSCTDDSFEIAPNPTIQFGRMVNGMSVYSNQKMPVQKVDCGNL